MANTSKKTESAPHTECDAPQLQESEFRERSATVVSLSQIKAPDGGWGYVILAGTSLSYCEYPLFKYKTFIGSYAHIIMPRPTVPSEGLIDISTDTFSSKKNILLLRARPTPFSRYSDFKFLQLSFTTSLLEFSSTVVCFCQSHSVV